MRVLITADTVGGVWRYASTLATALHSDGHSVMLAAIGDPSEPQRARLPNEVALESRRLRLEWMPDSEADIRTAAEWLADLERSWEADVVHFNQMTYPAAARFTRPTVTVVHSDVRSWFAEVRGDLPPETWNEYGRAVTAGLGASSVVVAPSAYQAALVARSFGPADVRVIHNGVDPPAEPVDHRRAYSRPPLVVMAGRAWDEAKGARILDEALTLLGDAAPRTHLLGDCRGPDGSRFVARTLACEGPVAEGDALDWMARATIYVGPSLYEPFGLAPAEAAVRGCGLLLSDIGSFRELWGGCAGFFPPGDPATLARLLGELVADPLRVARLAAAARDRALRSYSTDRFAADYLALYRTLYAPGASAARPVSAMGARATGPNV